MLRISFVALMVATEFSMDRVADLNSLGTMLVVRKRATLVFALAALLAVATTSAQSANPHSAGKDIVFDRAKGNCLACHGFPTIPDAEQTGNSGPPIIAMQARFPDKARLRSIIWDAAVSNSSSFMPPFGKHQVLSEEEIDKVVDFVHSL
jgi:sulfur-oxidizing protein SoxX